MPLKRSTRTSWSTGTGFPLRCPTRRCGCWDRCRLEQVVENLLANAVRYTDPGGELTIWVHPREGQAVIRIRDSGVGIAPDALPHIFDLFKQANGADPRSMRGLGVGLAVVRDLVALHGGSVTAASAGPGQGSEFTVRLPTES